MKMASDEDMLGFIISHHPFYAAEHLIVPTTDPQQSIGGNFLRAGEFLREGDLLGSCVRV